MEGITFPEDARIPIGVSTVEHLEPIDDFISVVIDAFGNILLLLFKKIFKTELFRKWYPCDLKVVVFIFHDDVVAIYQFLHEVKSNVLCQFFQF